MNNLARHETRFNAQTDSLGVGDDKIAFVMLSIVSPFMSSADEGGAASTWLMDGLPSVCTRTKAKAFRRRMVSVGSVGRCPDLLGLADQTQGSRSKPVGASTSAAIG